MPLKPQTGHPYRKRCSASLCRRSHFCGSRVFSFRSDSRRWLYCSQVMKGKMYFSCFTILLPPGLLEFRLQKRNLRLGGRGCRIGGGFGWLGIGCRGRRGWFRDWWRRGCNVRYTLDLGRWRCLGGRFWRWDGGRRRGRCSFRVRFLGLPILSLLGYYRIFYKGEYYKVSFRDLRMQRFYLLNAKGNGVKGC